MWIINHIQLELHLWKGPLLWQGSERNLGKMDNIGNAEMEALLLGLGQGMKFLHPLLLLDGMEKIFVFIAAARREARSENLSLKDRSLVALGDKNPSRK